VSCVSLPFTSYHPCLQDPRTYRRPKRCLELVFYVRFWAGQCPRLISVAADLGNKELTTVTSPFSDIQITIEPPISLTNILSEKPGCLLRAINSRLLWNMPFTLLLGRKFQLISGSPSVVSLRKETDLLLFSIIMRLLSVDGTARSLDVPPVPEKTI
jgi:hypothetical protein